jgi:hypothetical protein
MTQSLQLFAPLQTRKELPPYKYERLHPIDYYAVDKKHIFFYLFGFYSFALLLQP